MAGCEVVAAVEWEKHAAECYRLNHPTTHMIEGDIAQVTGAQIMNATGLQRGELDILDGSPPCQGFSTSGRRLLDDPRNALFKEHLRLVDALEPKHVVIENVSGMIRGSMKPVAAEVVSALKERGYLVAAGLMEAQYFGVAQRRPRVFFIASRLGLPRLPRPTSRPTPARTALRGVVPGEVPSVSSPNHRLLLRHQRPGEPGYRMLERLGRKSGRADIEAKRHSRFVVQPTDAASGPRLPDNHQGGG